VGKKSRRKRPDLRRDCDAASLSAVSSSVIIDGKDLIYEGIATLSMMSSIRGWRHGRKRPDLRRDCDIALARAIFEQ